MLVYFEDPKTCAQYKQLRAIAAVDEALKLTMGIIVLEHATVKFVGALPDCDVAPVWAGGGFWSSRAHVLARSASSCRVNAVCVVIPAGAGGL